MLERILLVAAAALAAGCVEERGPVGHLSIPGSRHTDYRITPDGISDARVSVSRVEDGHTFRGYNSGLRAEIELRVEGDMLKGSRANIPVNIKVVQTGNEIVATGFYGGKPTAIHILHEPQSSCAFRFDERDSSAQVNTCAAQNSMPIPRFMVSWPKEEQALYITVAFAEVFGVEN
jgi:hypothetical protein